MRPLGNAGSGDLDGDSEHPDGRCSLGLTGPRADEHAARATVKPIASLLAVQAVLEGVLGVVSDKSHPLTGMVFALYRLRQPRRARADGTPDRTPRVGRLLTLQTWSWRASVCLLLITTVGRTVMCPDAEAGTTPSTCRG